MLSVYFIISIEYTPLIEIIATKTSHYFVCFISYNFKKMLKQEWDVYCDCCGAWWPADHVHDVLDDAITYKNKTVPMFDHIDKLMIMQPCDFTMLEYGNLCNLYYQLLIEKAKIKNEVLRLKESYKIDSAKTMLNLLDGEKKMSIARIEEEIVIRLEPEKTKVSTEEFRYNILDAKCQGISSYITCVRDSLRLWATSEVLTNNQ